MLICVCTFLLLDTLRELSAGNRLDSSCRCGPCHSTVLPAMGLCSQSTYGPYNKQLATAQTPEVPRTQKMKCLGVDFHPSGSREIDDLQFSEEQQLTTIPRNAPVKRL